MKIMFFYYSVPDSYYSLAAVIYYDGWVMVMYVYVDDD